MSRHNLRENIFKILFKVEFNSIDEMNEQIEFSLDEIENLSDEDKAYITDKTERIISLIGNIDEIITDISEGWSLNRIGKAELAIIRLAVYEIKYDDDIPLNVAVSEAVELAKTYCTEDARSFINGVLTKLND
ncbi:MAG: transcription antitermination factor NusB [Lachnospiraceae bacterium]|nr:transcription antitermination factor NusB [Lachnospiraceae bacterium]